jgi:hypothetical protein
MAYDLECTMLPKIKRWPMESLNIGVLLITSDFNSMYLLFFHCSNSVWYEKNGSSSQAAIPLISHLFHFSLCFHMPSYISQTVQTV